MQFSLETSNLRAVVKNTFVHIEHVEDAFIEIGLLRKRRNSDLLGLRHFSQPCKLFESEAASTVADDVSENESEVLSSYADDASDSDAPHVAEVDTTPNADFDSLRVVIKKTFIHFELADEDCSEIGLLRRSCRRCRTDILHARDADAQSYMEESMPNGCRDQVVSPDALVMYEGSVPRSDAESNDDSRDMWNTWSNDCAASAIISVGSAAHFQGLCRPCVWFWRPETCKTGAACEYCHLCDEDALARTADTKKAIKKQKKNLNRHRRR